MMGSAEHSYRTAPQAHPPVSDGIEIFLLAKASNG
jgi:hypothetical protein